MSVDYLLHESPVGYAVFKVVLQPDTIGSRLAEVQKAVQDLDKFGKTVELVGLAPFQGTQDALSEINDVSEGIMSDFLRATLETNLPKAGKKKTITLGVSESNLAGSIKAAFPNLACETAVTSEVVSDLLRGLRQHSGKLIKQLQPGDIDRSILGLGHAYSRGKVKFSVQKQDNHIIQAIATLDQIDKDLNTFCMRLRENYGWHFPELAKIVNSNEQYAKVVLQIGDKSRLSDEDLHELAAVVDDDESIAQAIINAARTSMGRDLSAADMEIVMAFAKRTASLAAYRKQLSNYLGSRMNQVAPNLAALIGDTVGARLISKAGSLTNLSKYPASTVQILGAEKALFRALKTKHDTPKYGLIYHASLIGQATSKNKGKIARMLAAKSALGLRVDALSTWGITSEDKSDEPTEEEKSQIGRDARLGIERRLRALEGKPLKSIPNANATALGSGQKWDVKEARKYNPDADGLTGEEPAANGATPKKLVQEVDEDESMADADSADSESEEETKATKGGDKAAKKAEKEAKKARKAERSAKRAEKEAKKAAKEAKKSSKDSKKRKSEADDTTEKKKKKKSKD